MSKLSGQVGQEYLSKLFLSILGFQVGREDIGPNFRNFFWDPSLSESCLQGTKIFPGRHFRTLWLPFWILQAVWYCRQCGILDGAALQAVDECPLHHQAVGTVLVLQSVTCPTGNNLTGSIFSPIFSLFFFPVINVFHGTAALKKLFLANIVCNAQNLGVDPFPDKQTFLTILDFVGIAGAAALQAVTECPLCRQACMNHFILCPNNCVLKMFDKSYISPPQLLCPHQGLFLIQLFSSYFVLTWPSLLNIFNDYCVLNTPRFINLPQLLCPH